MLVTLTIDPWWIVAVLVYLLLGALGTLIYQSNCQDHERVGFGTALGWILGWPIGVVLFLLMQALR